jgi:hypothetical protein
MNCKPGDLAVIVKAALPFEALNIGHICEVLRPENHPVTGAPAWRITPPTRAGGYDCVLDALLRPIRDTTGDESFVTEARKSLVIERQNDKLKKVPA